MAAICGERYKRLAVTTGGYTFDNPYGVVGTPYDYVQWRSVAKKIMDLGLDHFVNLGEIEDEFGTYPKWNALVERKNKLVEHFENLPSAAYVSLSGMHVEEGVTEAMTVVSEALCFLDEVDLAIEGYRRAPPKIPGIVPKKKKPPSTQEAIPWWVWAGGAGLLVGAYVGWKRR